MTAEEIRKRAANVKTVRGVSYSKEELNKFLPRKLAEKPPYFHDVEIDDVGDEVELTAYLLYDKLDEKGIICTAPGCKDFIEDEVCITLPISKGPVVFDLNNQVAQNIMVSFMHANNTNLATEDNMTRMPHRTINIYTSVDAYMLGSISWFKGRVDIIFTYDVKEAIDKLHSLVLVKDYNISNEDDVLRIDGVTYDVISKRGVRC